ncbi:KH domain-containing protein akap-1-like [Ctenocephalides felis]|uniref:KH domain-containing protein akap-1-like n=1 Tax=Ctenocephalides felis TaxID=7515 RepID=UPI000E6E4F55|nr:KH domain-containing protein akap-1-like [Ctenocephalides felis]
MSAVRSIILLGLPGLAIVLGILWYRKRNPHLSDPGGSKKKLDKEVVESIAEKSFESDKSKQLEVIIEENLGKTEKPELNKSLPIDIPVGSPVELTDDQLDIEILKIQSQKSQEKDYCFNRVPKSISLEKKETLFERPEEMTREKTNKSQVIDKAEASSEINKAVVEAKIENTDNQPEIKEEVSKNIEKENLKEEVEKVESEIVKSESLKPELNIQKEQAMAEEKEDIFTSKTIESLEKINISEKMTSVESEPNKVVEDNERNDWSEELCELECQTENTENINTENIRDSAYHSPTENMSSSPQLSAYSDRHSEHSEDSGKGSSPRSELATTYEFIIPQTCVGRLIGRNGVFVNKIKSFTGANILIKNHPENLSKYKICAIDGLQTEIDAALVMIREKFPEKKYPNLTLQRVSFPPAVLTPEISPECVSLQLIEGVNNDCTVSCVLNGGIVSLQQPLHPSFPSLSLLQCCMAQTYSQNDNPRLPLPVKAGMVCACPLDCHWYRAQITNVFEPKNNDLNEKSEQTEQTEQTEDYQVELRLVDYGSRVVTEVSKLRQIRADLMMLPFQAVDCLLANVQPANGSLQWSNEADECLRHLTYGRLLQVQIYGFLDDVPLVHLYVTLATNQVMFVNQELVARGFAEWVETDA